MSDPCGCGQALPEEAAFCLACGSMAETPPAPPHATVVTPMTVVTVAAPAQPATSPPRPAPSPSPSPRPAAPTLTTPSHPAPAAPVPAARILPLHRPAAARARRPARSGATWLALCALVLAVVGVAASAGDSDPAPTTTEAPAGSVSDDGATTAPDRTAPPAGTRSEEPASAADELPADARWILVLHSTEKTLSIAEARQAAAPFDADPRVLVIDSDLHPSLNPGYWAVVAYGYSTEEEARADCTASFGLPLGGSCYQRFVG